MFTKLGTFALLTTLAASLSGSALMTDAEGDVQLRAHASTAGIPVPGFPTIDITAFEFEETPTDFVFTITVLETNPGAHPFNGNFRIDFELDERLHRFLFHQEEESGAVSGELYRVGNDQALQYVGQMIAFRDDDSNSYTALIPRDQLEGGDGRIPLGGSVLGAWSIRSQALYRTVNDITTVQSAGPFVDYLEDEGDEYSHTLQFGARQQGTAIQLNALPYYYTSNGEPGNVSYEIQVTHAGIEPLIVAPQLVDVPFAWNMTVEPLELALVPGEVRSFVVFGHVAGAHAHGSFADFEFKVTDLDSTDAATARLGMIYHSTPQPAGHHDNLHVHARTGPTPQAASRVTMNTNPQDPQSEDINARSWGVNNAPDTRRFEWTICLLPQLQQPIQMDETLGRIEVEFLADLNFDSAEAHGDLVLADTRNDPQCAGSTIRDDEVNVTLAKLEPASAGAIGATAKRVEMNIRATEPGLTFVPQSGQNLALRIVVDVPYPLAIAGTFTNEPSMYMAPGAQITLPLVDVPLEELQAFDLLASTRYAESAPNPAQDNEAPAISPGLLLLGLLAALAIIQRRRHES